MASHTSGVGLRAARAASWLIAGLGFAAFSCDDSSATDDDASAGGDGGESVGGASGAGKPGSSGGKSAQAGEASGGKTAAAGAAQGGSGGKPAGGGGGKPAGGSGNVSGAAAGGEASAGGASGNPDPSGGCNKPSPGWATGYREITVGGTKRSYFFVPPASYSSAKAYPIIVGFHGGGGNGQNGHDYFALEAPTGGQALLVFPSGNQGDGGWALQNEGPDMLLFDAILSEVEQAYCVDRARVFATGFSYGGWMATQVACARPNVVRAISSIAGGGPMGQCSAAVAAMIIHGTADGAEPIAAGEASRDRFRGSNGCGTGTSATDPAPCVAYAGCAAGEPLLWCAHPGDHGIPDFARKGMWDFFMGLP